MQVFVRTPSGRIFTLDLQSSYTTENIRTMMKVLTGTPESQQILTYNGVVMQDGFSLADYGIPDEGFIDFTVFAAPDQPLSIPTLSPSALVLLSGALALGALVKRRRQFRASQKV